MGLNAILPSRHNSSRLKRIIALPEKLHSGLRESAKTKEPKPQKRRIRRSGRDLAAFRKMLKAERKKGFSFSEMAKKHGVRAA